MTLLGAMALMALWLAAALPQAGSPAPPAPPAATARLSPAALRAVPWPELAGLEPAVQEALQQGSAGFTAAVAAGAVEAGGGAQLGAGEHGLAQAAGLAAGVDYVALSFVRRAASRCRSRARSPTPSTRTSGAAPSSAARWRTSGPSLPPTPGS